MNTVIEWIDYLSRILVAVGIMAGVIQNYLNGRKIETVHKATNSMKDELVAAVRKESFQAGQLDQQTRQ